MNYELICEKLRCLEQKQYISLPETKEEFVQKFFDIMMEQPMTFLQIVETAEELYQEEFPLFDIFSSELDPNCYDKGAKNNDSSQDNRDHRHRNRCRWYRRNRDLGSKSCE